MIASLLIVIPFAILSFTNIRKAAVVYLCLNICLPVALTVVNVPPFPRFSATRTLALILCLATARYYLNHRNRFANSIKAMPLQKASIFLIIAYTIVSLTSSIGVISSAQVFISFVLESLLCLVFIYLFIDTPKRAIYTYRLIIYAFIAIGVYGIIVSIIGHNPVIEYFKGAEGAGNVFDYAEKTKQLRSNRLQAIFFHPIKYGALIAMVIPVMVGFVLYDPSKLKKIVIGLGVVLLSINLLLTNSRSPYLLFILALFYLFISLRNKQKFRIVLIGGGLFLLGIPIIIQYIDVDSYINTMGSLLETFDERGNSEVGGSNITMRLNQLKVSFGLFVARPITGYGFGIIQNFIANSSVDGLLGAESFAFWLLIEMGVVGIITYVYFYWRIFKELYKRSTHSQHPIAKNFIKIAISVFLGFVAFILATGVQGTFSCFIIIVGLALRLHYLLEVEPHHDMTSHNP